MDKLLNADIEKQIQKMFEALKEPVAVLLFTSKVLPCDYCEEIRQLVTEVTALSPKLSMHEFDLEQDAAAAAKYRVERAPSFVVAAKNGDVLEDTGVIFSGIPAQYEFAPFLAALLMVSKRDSGLSTATRSYLATLTRPLNLQVFTTPT